MLFITSIIRGSTFRKEFFSLNAYEVSYKYPKSIRSF